MLVVFNVNVLSLSMNETQPFLTIFEYEINVVITNRSLGENGKEKVLKKTIILLAQSKFRFFIHFLTTYSTTCDIFYLVKVDKKAIFLNIPTHLFLPT